MLFEKLNNKKIYKLNPGKNWEIRWQNEYNSSLLLFITGRCNLKCKNCFSSTSRNTIEMDLENISKIINSNQNFKKIDLMGGEPLLHKQISEIIHYLKKENKDVSLYTNGINLHRITEDLMPIRACISFHEYENADKSRKPIKDISNQISNFIEKGNKIKLILLLDSYNYKKALTIINKVEEDIPNLSKITIGLMRYENDYWNDKYEGVLSFKRYYKTIKKILKKYKGNLDIDVFLKGVLSFEGDPGYVEGRTNRFKCVFQDYTYADCLYNACDEMHERLNADYKLPENKKICKHTGRCSCIADKVRLINRRKKND